MKKAKILLLSLILIMCAGVMTGCGDDDTNDGSTIGNGVSKAVGEAVTKASKGLDELSTKVSKGASELATDINNGITNSTIAGTR